MVCLYFDNGFVQYRFLGMLRFFLFASSAFFVVSASVSAQDIRIDETCVIINNIAFEAMKHRQFGFDKQELLSASEYSSIASTIIEEAYKVPVIPDAESKVKIISGFVLFVNSRCAMMLEDQKN